MAQMSKARLVDFANGNEKALAVYTVFNRQLQIDGNEQNSDRVMGKDYTSDALMEGFLIKIKRGLKKHSPPYSFDNTQISPKTARGRTQAQLWGDINEQTT